MDPTTIPLPVLLYDVVTTATPPRLVATCRNAAAQQDLATRLGKMIEAGDLPVGEVFTCAPPRSALAMVAVDPAVRVTSSGYDVDVVAVAEALAAALAPSMPVQPSPAVHASDAAPGAT